MALSLFSQPRPLPKIEITPTESSLSLGEPVIVWLSAKNESSMSATLDLGLNRESALRFGINGPNGSFARVSAPAFGSAETLVRVSTVLLAPGEEYSQRVRLSEWYPFSRIGTYRVTADIVGMPYVSGERRFTITIKPADPDRLRLACAQLLYKALYSSDRAAQDAAIDLGRWRDPIAIPYLTRMLAAQPVARASAIEGLSRIRTLDAIEALLRFAAYASEEDRGYVVANLKAI